MKKLINSLNSILLIIFSVILYSCQSAEQKVDEAEEELIEAEADLKDAATEMENDSVEILSEEAWKEYKLKSEQKIMEYENRIAELKDKMKKSGKLMDTYYEQRIISFENNVVELRSRLISQEKAQSNWESFKREFDHDMNELEKAITNFVEDDKK